MANAETIRYKLAEQHVADMERESKEADDRLAEAYVEMFAAKEALIATVNAPRRANADPPFVGTTLPPQETPPHLGFSQPRPDWLL